MNDDIPADDYLEALYEKRLLVFLEADEHCECDYDSEPHFHQIGLTSRQFKKVSDAIVCRTRKDDTLKEGYELAEIRFTASIPAEPFDGLSSTID